MNETVISQTNTTCPYCGVGCGVSVQTRNGVPEPVSGLANHPANFGKLCVKGSALHQTLDHNERLTTPLLNGQPANWDAALNLIADKIQQVINNHGPEAVAFYGSGQLLTEDYYVANKLMKGFIGSANMDTNSRLCMASAVAAYKRAFGSDTVPGCYEDLETTDLLLLVGSNTAWAHPIVYQRIVAAKKANPALKIVVIDPRKTATCDIADLHLAIKPGADGYLFNGLLCYLADNNLLDQRFIDNCTDHFAETLHQAKIQTGDLAQLAAITDLPVEDLETCFNWFGKSPTAVTVYSMGINQSSSGTDKANSIINAHLASGKIGKPGCAPFSITGQPNAMGGREVGGLANQLAAHMDFSATDRERVKRFWQAPKIAEKPGLKAVELFEAILAGQVKFLWIMSTNPLVSMPNADLVKRALAQCELVVVSDCMAQSDTAQAAHVLLPAASWGEKNGTVTNSERRISRQRGFLPPPGEAMPDWWAISQVGQRLGFKQAFDYQHPAEIFDEHARLSAFENDGSRDFDLSALVGMSQQQYDSLSPVQWPVNDLYPSGKARFFDDGHFYTENNRARFLAIESRLPELERDITEAKLPALNMNTGRVRDHWHTMTRTGKSARLAQHISEPFVDIHPDDAALNQLQQNQLVKVFNQRGEICVRANLTANQRPGEVFVPMHWNDRYANKARMGALINSDNDPVSGQPELKVTQVNIRPMVLKWQGFVLSRNDLFQQQQGFEPFLCDYWAYGLTEQGHFYEVAGNQPAPQFLSDFKRRNDHQGQWLTLDDDSQSYHRWACIQNGQLQAIVFIQNIDTPPADVNRQWLIDCFKEENVDALTRKALLAGRKPGKHVDPGKIVCSCFQVGENAIKQAIEKGADSADALGKQLQCGTNCGSCIPELTALTNQYHCPTPNAELASEITEK